MEDPANTAPIFVVVSDTLKLPPCGTVVKELDKEVTSKSGNNSDGNGVGSTVFFTKTKPTKKFKNNW